MNNLTYGEKLEKIFQDVISWSFWWAGILFGTLAIFVFHFTWTLMILAVGIGILIDVLRIVYRCWKLNRQQ